MLLSRIRRLSPLSVTAAAFSLLAGSGVLLWMHAASVRDMREIGLPAVVALPRIEKRMEILAEQNEIAELQAALRGGSEEERLRVYVLPDTADVDRLLAALDVLFGYLEQKRQLASVSGVEVGEEEPVSDTLAALPVSFEAVVRQEGMSALLQFVELSGLLTVSDALAPADVDALLALTEQEQPASIAALEQFLATDLLRYGQEPAAFEEQVRASFSPAAEETLQALFQAPLLRRARTFFADIGPILRRQHLWPLRLLTVKYASLREEGNGLLRVRLILYAYVRHD